MPISNARLSQLIGLIYDCAVDPGRWPDALEAMRLELNAANFGLNLLAVPEGAMLLNLTGNIPRDYAARMPDYVEDVVDMWGGKDAMDAHPLNEPAVLTRVHPISVDYARTVNRYAQEWARPQDLVDLLAIILARDDLTIGGVAFGRHKSFGPYGKAEIELASLLIPHLQRAATINRLLEMSEGARQSFASVIDALATAVVLVSGDLQILHANPAARDVLEAGVALRNVSGRLTGRTVGVTRALAVAVEQAMVDEAALGHKGLGIPAPDADGNPGALYVLPLAGGQNTFGPGPGVAVFYTQSASMFIAPADLVGALFGLTPSEARVFTAVARGASLAEAAAALQMAASTVKTHLLRIYSKTGVSRQADLVRLASSLAAPIAA